MTSCTGPNRSNITFPDRPIAIFQPPLLKYCYLSGGLAPDRVNPAAKKTTPNNHVQRLFWECLERRQARNNSSVENRLSGRSTRLGGQATIFFEFMSKII